MPSPRIPIRALVALDLAFHGSGFMLVEFGVGMLLASTFGLLLIHADLANQQHPTWLPMLLGSYLVSVAINYLPLMLYSIHLVRAGSVHRDVARYVCQSREYLHRSPTALLPLLVMPFALVLVVAIQEWQTRYRATESAALRPSPSGPNR